MASILIVDKDEKFYGPLRADPLANTYPVLVAENGRKAQVLLKDNDQIAAVFVSLDVSTGGGHDAFSVVRFSKTVRPQIPVFILDGTRNTEFTPELKRIGVSGVLDKSLSYSMLVSLAGLDAIHFNEQDALDKASKNRDKIGVETSTSDQAFFPILASEFVSGSDSLFDVFVKIRAGVYVKILKAGDSFVPERLKGYQLKGATHFYMRNEVRAQYLAYCGKLAGKALQVESLNPATKASLVMNFGEEVTKYLATQGLDEQRLQYAESFVGLVRQTVSTLPIENSGMMAKFMSNIASFDHGVSTTLIAGLIAKQMGIESESSVQIVGVAGLFHDIGLTEVPEKLHDEDTFKMSSVELALFNKHPEIGHRILSEVHGIHPSVLQAVLQHHQRKVKGASGTHTKMISRVSEIVGISDEFVHLIKNATSSSSKSEAKSDQKSEKSAKDAEQEKNSDPCEVIQEEFSGFSSAVVDAFRRTFFPKKN